MRVCALSGIQGQSLWWRFGGERNPQKLTTLCENMPFYHGFDKLYSPCKGYQNRDKMAYFHKVSPRSASPQTFTRAFAAGSH